MSSPTDVVNDALVSVLGQAPIANLDDGTANANRAQIAYYGQVDSVLRMTRWKCARFFAELVEDPTKANFKWAHAFKLPMGDDLGDGFCLRVWEVNQSEHTRWTRGGGNILYVDDTSAHIEYIGRVTDPTLWDPNLYDAISMSLASKLAVSILHDLKLSQQLYVMAQDMINDAIAINGQEGSVEKMQTNELIDVRGDGGWVGGDEARMGNLIRRLVTNFTRGELSPQIEGRPDLQAFFNGASIIENFWVYFEGGVFRRYGTSRVSDVKEASKRTYLIDFKFSQNVAYAIEAGDHYFRFYRRGFGGNPRLTQIRLSAGAQPLEVVVPYGETDYSSLQWAQSADVLFLTHPDFQQRKLNRVSDTEWLLTLLDAKPPPSFEADSDISGENVIPPTGGGPVEPPSDGGSDTPSTDGEGDDGTGGGDDGGSSDDSSDGSDGSDDGGGDGGA